MCLGGGGAVRGLDYSTRTLSETEGSTADCDQGDLQFPAL